MKKTNTTIELGEIIQFTSGEYSDFSTNGMFVCIKEFNLKDIIQDMTVHNLNDRQLRRYPGHPFPYCSYEIMAEIIKKGYGVPLTYRDIHIADRSDLSEDLLPDNHLELKKTV